MQFTRSVNHFGKFSKQNNDALLIFQRTWQRESKNNENTINHTALLYAHMCNVIIERRCNLTTISPSPRPSKQTRTRNGWQLIPCFHAHAFPLQLVHACIIHNPDILYNMSHSLSPREKMSTRSHRTNALRSTQTSGMNEMMMRTLRLLCATSLLPGERRRREHRVLGARTLLSLRRARNARRICVCLHVCSHKLELASVMIDTFP